ncbi:amidohydrolase [Polynucleobacter arcticus]|uniref:Twin-arginine translocation pathway signal protein n=1 Tax=Polynucleobacter arcticus TaxID=1743165 RepID=A0A6M9PEB9_9BURK|nr:amidohydrolase [Polynucleobacter arcticus]QKM61100.1 twin-arginine translocation pathway signal protein [Polynucleobacter arcticus]
MKLSPKLLTFLLMAQCATTFAKGNADTIFFGGPIVTVNQKNEEVQALAVQNGKIVAVGTKDAVTKEWQAGNTKIVDLNGQTLMPGFIEPHVHIMVTSVFEGLGLNLSNFTLPYDTLDTLSQKMKAALKNVPPGGWLFGFGVDPSRTTPFMAEFTADDLDKVSKDVPIFIVNQSGHIAYVNNKALELAGVTNKTPNPAGGGVYVKDAKGKLTGKLVEPPSYLPFLAKMPAPTEAQLLGAIQGTLKKIASTGVTTASEMSVGGNFGVDKEVAIYKSIFAKNASPIRVRGYLFSEAMPTGKTSIKPNEGDDQLRFIGIKYISDGSTQGLTAALNAPYSYPKNSKWSGALNFKDADIHASMKSYFDQGWQISTHANGDKAIDQTLNNYSKVLAGNPKPQERRLRIEHFTVNNESQVKKAVKLGVVPSFTIGHVDYWGAAFNDHIIGPERAKRIDPAGDFKRAGGKFTLHSDTPVSNVGPLNYVSEEVTRLWQLPPQKVLGPDQAVSVDDAIRAITIDAAYQIFADNIVGSLEVGKQADFVVLEKNPRTTPPSEIRNIKVQGTWIDGKRVGI